MSSPEQTVPSIETKEKIVFVPNEVADALGKAAGGLVGVEVTRLPDEKKHLLVGAVKKFESDEHVAVQHAARTARIEGTVDDHTMVRVTTANAEVAQGLADNLVSVAIDKQKFGLGEDADAETIYGYSATDAATRRNLYHELSQDVEDGLDSGYEYSPEDRQRIETELAEYKKEYAKAVSDDRKHDGIHQVIEVVKHDRDDD